MPFGPIEDFLLETKMMTSFLRFPIPPDIYQPNLAQKCDHGQPPQGRSCEPNKNAR